MLRRIILAAAVATTGALAGFASPALAGTTPRVPAPAGSVFSTEQAGYQVSHAGRSYRFISATFTLPDASQYAANVGSFGLSVQGWGPAAVVVLGISTCATDSCQTGGNPVTDPWNAAIAVYGTKSHALITADGASPAMAAGDSVTEALYYNTGTGNVQAKVTDNTTLAVFTAAYHAGLGQGFKAVRAGLETSAVSPWGAPAFTYAAPAAAVTVATLGQVAITNTSGHRDTLADTAYASAAPVTWTRNGGPDGAVNAAASAPTADGRSFTISLEP